MSLSGMLSSLELLEARIAPAGLVTLKGDAFSYILTGDAEANDLVITQDGAKITLTPQNGTKILNTFAGQTVASTDPVTLRLLDNDLIIQLGDGADVLELDGLTLPFDLVVDMGSGTAADTLTVTDLWVGGSLFTTVRTGTASFTGETLHVANNAELLSSAQTFSVDVGSFYIGEDLTVVATLNANTDTFTLEAASFLVYDDFSFAANVKAADVPLGAISVSAVDTLNVGGNLQVISTGTADATVAIGGETVILSELVFVKNSSGSSNKELTLFLEASSALRMDGGLSITSTSTAPSAVRIEADLVIVDGPVTAKLPTSGGELSIIAVDALQIGGNVNFAAKGEGTLHLEGGGDIFGKVSASLGSGTGAVEILGANERPLRFDGLKITAPTKIAPTSGINVLLEDVSLFGKVSMALGRGADTVNINDSVFRSAVSIATGDGNDTVRVHTEGTSYSEFRSGLNVSLGAGNDVLVIGRAEPFDDPTALLVYGRTTFNGGAGTDNYLASNRNVKFFKSFSNRAEVTPIVRAFEADLT